MKEEAFSQKRKLFHRGLMLEYFSLAWMVVESLVAIGAGLAAGSLALLAFGGDSLIELISAYAVAIYIRELLRKGAMGLKVRPKKQTTEWIAAILLVSLIPVIGLGAVYSYLVGIKPESSLLGIAIAFGAVVIMPYLWIEKRRIGQETGCLPLSIDAVESATCFFMSVALLAGLVTNYFLRLGWVDYVATAIILAFVAKEAFESVKEVRSEERKVAEPVTQN